MNKICIITRGDERLGKLVQQALIDAGFSWGCGKALAYLDKEAIFACRSGLYLTHSSADYALNSQFEHQATVIDLQRDPITKVFDFIASSKVVRLKLNDKHTAIVHADTQTVEVGCQTFTFERVKALAEACK